MANNSAVYNKKPSATKFMEEWLSLAKSGTGERGIFNRAGLEKQMPQRRWKKFKKYLQTSGTNPCREITLRDKQFCNLTEIVARPEDTEESLLKKAEIVAILGTYQLSLTDFPYISKEWEKNCDEERLMGGSITGQWDCPTVRNPKVLKNIYKKILETNREYAKKSNINPSTSVSLVKQSGTVSQLVNAAPGMHPRHSPYYTRRIRISAGDPLFRMLREQKVPYHPEVGQTEATADQLEYWKMVKENYTEHNPL